MIGKELLDFSAKYLMTSVLFSRIGFPESPPFPIFSKVSLEALRFSLETEVLVAIIPSILVSATNSTISSS